MFVVLDTNHLRELSESSSLGTILRDRLRQRGADTFTCVVAAEESLFGWITFIRRHRAGAAQLNGYFRLQCELKVLRDMHVLPFDAEAATVFETMSALRLRIGSMDLKIAAICIAYDALLLSRNLVDFQKVPGLRVENWLD